MRAISTLLAAALACLVFSFSFASSSLAADLPQLPQVSSADRCDYYRVLMKNGKTLSETNQYFFKTHCLEEEPLVVMLDDSTPALDLTIHKKPEGRFDGAWSLVVGLEGGGEIKQLSYTNGNPDITRRWPVIGGFVEARYDINGIVNEGWDAFAGLNFRHSVKDDRYVESNTAWVRDWTYDQSKFSASAELGLGYSIPLDQYEAFKSLRFHGSGVLEYGHAKTHTTAPAAGGYAAVDRNTSADVWSAGLKGGVELKTNDNWIFGTNVQYTKEFDGVKNGTFNDWVFRLRVAKEF